MKERLSLQAEDKFNSQSLREKMVRMKGLEPSRLAALEPKSSVSTNSTTSAQIGISLIT